MSSPSDDGYAASAEWFSTTIRLVTAVVSAMRMWRGEFAGICVSIYFEHEVVPRAQNRG
jgi:hypothetical protein